MSDEVLKRKQYVYFRRKDKDGRWDPKGGITVCYLPVDGSDKAGIGISVCSLKDVFCKRIGRSIAEGRAAKNITEFAFSPLMDWEELRGFAEEIAFLSCQEERGYLPIEIKTKKNKTSSNSL